ncbi:MAG: hypothetical protein WCJ64_15065 [Rhodospirillaceae bacterium]
MNIADLTREQKLLLLSTNSKEVLVTDSHPAPDWLVEQCIKLGLAERIGRTSAWKLSELGAATREEMLKDEDDD